MHTLVDFLTRVKGIEYLISVLAITGFSMAVAVLKVLFWIFLALLVIDLILWLASGGRRPIAT